MESIKIYLSQDLFVQILARLPISSLLRCKCVCKSWNQIISSKSFCKLHLAHQKTSLNTKRYLLFDRNGFYSANLIDYKSCVDVETSNPIGCYRPKSFGIDFANVRWSSYAFLKVYGICNGLLCLSDGQLGIQSTIYLWNPIARRGKQIPPHELNLEAEIPGLSFGYHDDDYKVIKLGRSWGIYSVYIYNLSTDCWRFLKFDVPHNIPPAIPYDKYMQYPHAGLVNGIAYFVKEKPLQVVCFDFSNEIIRVVDFPENFKQDSSWFAMNDDGGSITLSEICKSEVSIRGRMSTDVLRWILNEKFTWEKNFTFYLKNCYVLGFIDDTKVFVKQHHSNKFMVFNLETNRLTEFKFRQQFQTLEERKNVRRIDAFVESLVLLDASKMNQYIVEKNCSSNTTAFTLHKWN